MARSGLGMNFIHLFLLVKVTDVTMDCPASLLPAQLSQDGHPPYVPALPARLQPRNCREIVAGCKIG